VGNLIPAGTGLSKYRRLHVEVKTETGAEEEVEEKLPVE